MNKNVLGLVLIPFILSGCVKKAEEKTTEKIEKTPTTKVKEPPPKEENVIPAMIVRNFVVKFEQPKICGPNPDVEGLYVLLKKLLRLKVILIGLIK
ncbi:hypothetical protein MKS77_10935 [Acinetobacter baumannii]